MKYLRHLALPLIAVLAAFIAGGIVVLLIGDDPVYTYRLLIGSALSWPDGIGYTLFYATPLTFTGLAVAVGFRCGLFNIGAEGQLTIAALATAWIGFTFSNLSAWMLVPLACAAAILAGAVWAAIPGVLKARFGSHEVINTIMMNFIAAGVTSALTQSYFKDPGDLILQTHSIAAAAHIPRLGRFIRGMPERIPTNIAFLLAIAACVLVYVFLWKTRWGYEIRATGAGFCYNIGRIAAAFGTVFFGLYSNVTDLRRTLFLVSFLFIPAGIVALFLPDLTREEGGTD